MVVNNILDYEIVHWNEENLFIAHKANIITYRKADFERKIKIPTQSIGWRRFFLPFRKARRALRLDKTMIVPNRNGFVAIRNGHIYIYNEKSNSWSVSDMKLNCRNPMYNGMLRVNDTIYIGEYGNPNGIGKRILMSDDDGYTWKCVHQFKPDEIRHIHALEWDPFEKKIWIFTGDFNPEPQVFKASPDFSSFERVGGGTQCWRACHAIFTKDYVHWIMDCPLEEVHHIKLNRASREIVVGATFAGPVWYARGCNSHFYATSAQEIGPSHKDKKLHIYRSNDLDRWDEIASFDYDGWPKRYFRFGIITTARGKDCLFCCEGVKGYDGKTISLFEEEC